MAEEPGDKQDMIDFDSAGQELGYIGIDQARVVAMSHARDNPDFYGDRYSGITRWVSDLIGAEESDDYYDIKLSYRPAGRFRGEPGIEQFIIDKSGIIQIRQLLDEPTGIANLSTAALTPLSDPTASGSAPASPKRPPASGQSLKNPTVNELKKFRVADEVWIATALLHRELPDRESFSVSEILARASRENIFGRIREGVEDHARYHCIANKAPKPNRLRMLFETQNGNKRLFKFGDYYHPERLGKIKPFPQQIPDAYHELLRWYDEQYNAGRTTDVVEELIGRHVPVRPGIAEETKQVLGPIVNGVISGPNVSVSINNTDEQPHRFKMVFHGVSGMAGEPRVRNSWLPWNCGDFELIGPKQTGVVQIAQAGGETKDVGKVISFKHDRGRQMDGRLSEYVAFGGRLYLDLELQSDGVLDTQSRRIWTLEVDPTGTPVRFTSQ